MRETARRRYGYRRSDRRWSAISATLFVAVALVVLMLMIVVDLKG